MEQSATDLTVLRSLPCLDFYIRWNHIVSYRTYFADPDFSLSMCAQSLWSCLTLGDPVDCSLPGSSVHAILKARLLEWLPCPPAGDLPDPGIKWLQEGGPLLGPETGLLPNTQK